MCHGKQGGESSAKMCAVNGAVKTNKILAEKISSHRFSTGQSKIQKAGILRRLCLFTLSTASIIDVGYQNPYIVHEVSFTSP